LLTVSDAYDRLGETENALSRAEQAKKVVTELVVAQPGNEEWKRLLYGSLFRIG